MITKKKRVVLPILAIILLIAPVVMISAGGQQGAGGPVELKYWSVFAGSDQIAMFEMLDKFMSEDPDIDIEHSITDSEAGNYYTALPASMAGGNPPDIAIMHTRYIPAFGSEEFLYVIDNFVRELDISKDLYAPIAWNGGAIEGKRFALPLDIIVTMVLYYNKDLFSKAGISQIPTDGRE